MLSEKDIALIDEYLLGQLKGDELLAFEERLQNDAIFFEEVSYIQSIAQGFERIEIRKQLEQIEQDEVDQKKVIPLFKSNYQKLAVAAGLLLLLSLPFVVFQILDNSSSSSDKMIYGSSNLEVESADPGTVGFLFPRYPNVNFIDNYTLDDKAIHLKMNYAGDEFLNASDWANGLMDKRPKQIDLVMTLYPSNKLDWSDDFFALIGRRMNQLYKLDSVFLLDQTIKWNIYLQKGDQSSVMANRKLHGIVVNYQDLSTESDEKNYCNVLNRCRDRHYAKMKEKSKLENILKRNVNNWNNMLLITDCTGSMEPYGAETVLGWLLKLKKNKIKQFSFFNDGDGMAQKDKKIGEVGGVHLVDEINNLQDFINTIRITTILGYGNADEPENDAEAILTSINQTSGFEDVVLIADNNSSVRDKELFEEIMHPVHVILCGVDNDSIEIHKDYILLAYLTNGSIHTVNNDYLNIKSPNTLSK